jgi:hypothetical protein
MALRSNMFRIVPSRPGECKNGVRCGVLSEGVLSDHAIPNQAGVPSLTKNAQTADVRPHSQHPEKGFRYFVLMGRQSSGHGAFGFASSHQRVGVYNRPMLISLGTGSVEPSTGEDFVAESETSGFDHLSRFRNESPS